MKKFIISLSVLAASVVAKPATGQDMSITIVTQPASVPLGSTARIRVDVCNADQSNIPSPANAVIAMISTSSVAEITGVTNLDGSPVSPANGGLQQIYLEPGAAGSVRVQITDTVGNLDCKSFYVVLHTIAVGTLTNQSSTLQWTGAQTNNNDVNNDNSGTTLTVTTPLPVSLTTFTAVKKGSTSLLDWNTALEINNAGFDVERSADGRTFSKIGVVYTKAENGNSSKNIDYTYTDGKPLTGINYYRLRQVDRDGISVYSKVEQVSFDGGTGVKVYPNPASNTVNIEASADSKVSVYNTLGQRIQVSVKGNGRLKTLDVSALSAGNYTIHIQDASGLTSHKLTVVK